MSYKNKFKNSKINQINVSKLNHLDKNAKIH